MKRSLCLILALVLVFSCAGCGEEIPLVPRTVDGLTITLPENFVDLSDEELFSDFSFMFSYDPVAVSGLREEKEAFRKFGLELSVEDYASLLIKAHNVSSQLQQTDGIWNFSYESGGFTYVVTVWDTADAFWTVQAYCPTENYRKVSDDMWLYLSSVTF